MGMKQFHWNHIGQNGKIHKIGLLHGARTGHVLIHINGRISSIDFKVLESKQYSLFLNEELIELNIIRHDDHFEYTMEINEEVKTPLNKKRKKEKRKVGIQTLVFGLVVATSIIIASTLFLNSDWYKEKNNISRNRLASLGLFTKGKVFTKGENQYTYSYVVNNDVYSASAVNSSYPVLDGDEYMVKYLPTDPYTSEVHFVKPTKTQVDKMRKASIAYCQKNQQFSVEASCECMVDSAYKVAGYDGMITLMNKDLTEVQNMRFNKKTFAALTNSDKYKAELSTKCQ